MDKDTFNASIEGSLLLFDGGMRKGYREQATGYVALMKEESRRTEKVIREQLMESLMSAQHYKAGYDHVALQSKLDLVVGTEVLNQLEEK